MCDKGGGVGQSSELSAVGRDALTCLRGLASSAAVSSHAAQGPSSQQCSLDVKV